jgi:RecA-family ATPase
MTEWDGWSEEWEEAAEQAALAVSERHIESVQRRYGLPPAVTPPRAPRRAERLIESVPASEIEAKPVRWLWDGRLPCAMLSLLAGEEGLGKSQVSIAIAAQLTRGELEGAYGNGADVLFAITEDTREHVAKPRLEAAGADTERVHFVDVIEDDQTTGLELPADSYALMEHAAELGSPLVVIDPLSAFLDRHTDSHKDKDVRAALAPLAAAAEEFEVAALGIMHINKGSSTVARNRLMGSVGFRAAARSVLVLGLDPLDARGAEGGARVLALDKHNLGPPKQSVRIQIESAEVCGAEGTTIPTSSALFGEYCDHNATDVLGAAASHADAPKRREAEDFLRDQLGGGPLPTAEIHVAGEAAGISKATLRRAKEALEVEAVQQAGGWYWRLPDEQPAI